MTADKWSDCDRERETERERGREEREKAGVPSTLCGASECDGGGGWETRRSDDKGEEKEAKGTWKLGTLLVACLLLATMNRCCTREEEEENQVQTAYKSTI